MSSACVLLEKVLDGRSITFDESLSLAEQVGIKELLQAANQIRESYRGNLVELCGVMNIKSGKCGEDCKYCSQSGHYITNVQPHDLVSVEEVVSFAKQYQQWGISYFGLSTSGKAFSETDKEKIYRIYKILSQETKMKLCGAHGLLTEEEAVRLRESGLSTYQHNLQTSRGYFSNICTTHLYDERVNTVKYARKAGLNVCSGGIMGLGESMNDRIEMAITLRELDIQAMPVNILNPIPGTPLGSAPIPLVAEEVLRTIAIFRFILPDVNLIYGAGRAFLDEKQHMALKAGLNGIVVGNFLTTPGKSIEEDIAMLKKEGFVLTIN